MFTPPSSLSVFSRQFLVALGVYSFSLSVGAQLLPPPSIPAGVPDVVTLSIDVKDSAHKPDQDSPTELRDWYGEKESTLQSRYVEYKAKNYEADVFAGWSNDAGVTVTNNRLLIDTEAEIGSAYGGYLLNTGTVSGNLVEVLGTAGNVAGGYVKSGGKGAVATGNYVVFKADRSVSANAESGEISIYGGYARSGEATNNTVVIEKGASLKSQHDEVKISIYGGEGNFASSNGVHILGEVKGTIYGGFGAGEYLGENVPEYVCLYGVSCNNVSIAGTVTGNVYAAVVESKAGIANSNFLFITGMVDGDAVVVLNSGQVGAANELHLYDGSTVTGMAGGVVNKNGNISDLNQVNRLWVFGTTKVGSLAGFNAINVVLADAPSEAPALTVTNSDTLNLQNVTVAISGGRSKPSGQVFKLFAFSNAEGSLIINDSTSFENWTSLFAKKEWVLDTRGLTASADGTYTLSLNNLVLSDTGELAATDKDGNISHVLGKSDLLPTSDAKTLSEAFLGTVAFVNQGAEFIADEGLQAINQAVQGSNAFTTFGAIHGGVSRYETGSHVKLRGTSLAAGAAGHVGSAVLAGFVEAGWGNSDSHVNSARGDATHDYYGVGVAGRWNITQPVYAEGSLRIGVASTDFDGQYVQGSAHYESDAFYASAHLGAGYIMDLGRNALDLYGRYTLTYLDSDEADLGTSTGDRLAMSSTTAHAVRFGARLTGELTPTVTWKAGAAFEHVFNGDADARVMVAGMTAALDTPSLSGNTGIVELGLTMKPAAGSPWSAAAGLKGYVGDRRGVAGNVTVQYAF